MIRKIEGDASRKLQTLYFFFWLSAQAAREAFAFGGTPALFRNENQEDFVLKLVLKSLAVASMVVVMASAAENRFVGQWKLNPSKTRMPDEMKVEGKGGNTYSFDFGGGVETIVVDGTDQPGYGGTLLSVKAEAPDTWIVERKKDGRSLLKATWKLSQDGVTLTDFFRGVEPNGATLSVDYVYQRNGGGSGFAADWQSIKETMNSPYLLRVTTYESSGLSFISNTPEGQRTKNAKLDGKDHPTQGPNASPGSFLSSRKVDERTLEMTSKVGGKVVDTREIVLSPDGKTLTMTVHVQGQSKPYVLVFDRE